MRLVILHNAVSADGPLDEQDVLLQSRAVSEALMQLGHEVFSIACGLDLSALRQALENIQPDVVFNLVESLNGHGRLIHVVPFLLDSMEISYTGSSAETLYATSCKTIAKERMDQTGLPWEIFSPGWIGPHSQLQAGRIVCDPAEMLAQRLWIIKSVWEHASVGLTDDAVIEVDRVQDIIDILGNRARKLGGDCFAERYIEGREFNLSLLEDETGPQALPPAEIVFEGYAPDKPRIVGYRAKWEVDSFEYVHTRRRFEFSPADVPLLTKMRQIAIRCWELFNLKGYARVDFRVDEEGHPWVLEINANPCLSPDAGFAAALGQAGIPYRRAIEQIVAAIPSPTSRVRRTDKGRSRQTSVISGTCPETDAVAPLFRYEALPEDARRVGQLVAATGFFYPDEIDTAMELVEERITSGPQSGYFFVFCEDGDGLIGYTCYGPIPCTKSGYDIYWIAVRPDAQEKEWGRKLMAETERLITEAGGSHVYVDTSARPQYGGTRRFYERCGYREVAMLTDFYGPEDGKVIFRKLLPTSHSSSPGQSVRRS